MNIVSCENLIYRYNKFNEENDEAGYTLALDDISLSIEKGSFVAVLGHNGSGKSTFAKHLNVLLKPESGKVYVNGMDTSDDDKLWLIRQKAGMVFQNPDNQLVATVVEEDVAFGVENLGVPSQEIKRRVTESLKKVGMEEFRKNAPNLLSGGQKQRVAIAGVLAMKPDLIILDEPTAMLDPIGRKETLETALSLNRDEGITVVLITHFMEEAAQAGRVIVMNNGKIAMDGSPREIFSQVEELKRLGLDVPQVTELARLLKDKGLDINANVITIEEIAEELINCRGKDGHKSVGHPEKDGGISPNISINNNPQGNFAVELKNLTHVYGKKTVFEKKALDDISLTIEKGELFGIIGHTGSGKSTLIQHLNGILKPDGGTILINGEDINAGKQKLKSARLKVGLCFQYPEHQLFETTVFRDVAFGPGNLGLSQQEVTERAEKALELVGIPREMYEKSPFELSGGEKRRAAIAGVLAMEPEILIMDEPTAGLDPRGRDEIFAQIKKIHREMKNTVIIVSHSMDDMARIAGRIAVLDRGRLKYLGEPEKVFRHGRELEEIGLSAPQITYLIKALNQRGFGLNPDIFTVEAAGRAIYEALRGAGE